MERKVRNVNNIHSLNKKLSEPRDEETTKYTQRMRNVVLLKDTP